MQKSSLKIIKALLILTCVGLILWLINLNFPSSGEMEVNAVLGKDLPIISSLGPSERLKLETDHQAILDNQVYFNLRAMPWFKEAVIYMDYQEDGRKLDGIGGKVSRDWNYQIEKPMAVVDGGNEFLTAVFKFDLNKFYKPKNMTRFLISTSEQREDGKLRVIALRVILKR